MKVQVEVVKNADGRPEILTFVQGNKRLKVVYEWDDEGYLRTADFSGPLAQELGVADKVQLLDRKFIERIALINHIDLIRLIKRANIHVIDERSIAFGSGYSDGWRNTNASTNTIEGDSVLGRVFKFVASTSDLYFYVNLDTNIFTKIRYTGWQLAGGGSYWFYVGFSDGANEIWKDVASTTRTRFEHQLKPDKTLTIVAVNEGFDAQADGYFGAPEIYDSEADRWLPLTSSMGTVQAEVLSLPAITGTLTQSTKHDAATYKSVQASLNADGNLVAGVANKLIKLHGLFIQATATVEGDIKDKSGGTAYIHFKLQDREGVSFAFIPYPGFWMKSLAAADPLYVDFSTAAQCYFTAIYTDADAA